MLGPLEAERLVHLSHRFLAQRVHQRSVRSRRPPAGLGSAFLGESKVRFAFSPRAVMQAALSISARALPLARIVGPERSHVSR